MTLSDGTHLTIRFAGKGDMPLVLGLIQELADYEKLRHEVVADLQLLTESLFGKRKYAEVLIAERDGQPLAFALFFHSFSTFLARPGIYLEDLFVKPEGRGLGIGRQMMIRIAQLAEERGCGRFEWSVLDWNAPAIGFYERLGAKPLADWTVYRLDSEKLRQLAQSGNS